MVKPSTGNIDCFCWKLTQINIKGLLEIPWEHNYHSMYFCLRFTLNLYFGGFFKHLPIFDQKWQALGHLNLDISKKFLGFFFPNFAGRHQIDVRRGMPSFASISVTPRTLFKKRGGGRSDTHPGSRGLISLSGGSLGLRQDFLRPHRTAKTY